MNYTFLIGILITLFSFFSCNNTSEKNENLTTNSIEKKDGLMIYAFHGTRQCETCKNMKAFTKSTLEKYFKAELKSGKISYEIIDVDDEKNTELAEKFEATGTALMINKIKNGKDKIEDWSNFAFEFANGDQKTFETKLKAMIEAKLK
jgi:hypothetical protein